MRRVRRKPVPAEFRDEHYLSTRSHAWGSGWHRTSRTRGRCSCGAEFPASRNVDNLDYAGVVDAHKDHVAREYHGENYYTITEDDR